MLYVLIVLVLLILAAFLFIYIPKILPDGAGEAADRALALSDLPNPHVGKPGFANSNGTSIWYESIGNPKNPTILLIMGHSCTALVWPQFFWQPLVDAGFHVIRYDNRGLGLSDWVEDWETNPEKKYNLEDMAGDALTILDHLKIDKAHLVGVSMGGMIAQRLAISHASRVLSLTSYMSSGFFFKEDVPDIMFRFKLHLFRLILRYRSSTDERKQILFRMGMHEAVSGAKYKAFDLDHQACDSLFEQRHRRGTNPNTWKQHGYAIKKSGSRLAELKSISCPTLIIHGTDDPLVRFEHAKVYAPLIPGAKTLFFEDMGHVISEEAAPLIQEALLEMIGKPKKTFRWKRRVGQGHSAGKKANAGIKSLSKKEETQG